MTSSYEYYLKILRDLIEDNIIFYDKMSDPWQAKPGK